jgi:hypothetical protein
MSTLAGRAEQRDRARFVGRAAELSLLEAVLRGDRPESIVHVCAPGGAGKSTLLREAVRRATALGLAVVWIEGRELPPFPDALERALGGLDPKCRTLVVIDSYELISSLDSHLRDLVIPGLPEQTVVLIGGRGRPARGWFESGWDTLVGVIEVAPLASDEAEQLVRLHGIEDATQLKELVRASHGSPLALVVGATTGSPASVADLADRLLGEEVDPDRYRTLSVAAIARITTPDLLGAVLPDCDPHDAYKWLADRSFAEPLTDGVALHALVAQSVRQSLRRRDPVGEGELRRRIADHLYHRALAGRFGLSVDLQHLVVDETVRWGYAMDIGSRYRVDAVRPGDTEHIGGILTAIGVGEWWERTRAFFDHRPEVCGVARDDAGQVCGYYVAVTPGSAPPEAESDVLLGPWLRYARETLGTSSVVMWREAVDLTGDNGEVTPLLGAGGIIGSGVINPRYGFLPIDPILPAAVAFAEALDARHVPELDFEGLGMHLQCYIVDFGPGGTLGFQRDWIYRETGALAPAAPELHAGQLVRLLRQPAALADGPAWLGDRPSTRHAALRRLVAESLSTFGSSPDDQLARQIIEAAYLGESAAHEAIARSLHLSRSAYFRRHQAALTRVEDELAGRRTR